MWYQDIIENSVEDWNQWRREHPTLLPNLSGANLSRCYLLDANLSGTNLSGANLSHACLIGSNLSRANLSDANLEGAYLDQADLRSANLHYSNLIGASFNSANLSYADLSNAKINKADLVHAQYRGAVCSIRPAARRDPVQLLWQGKQTQSLTLQAEFGYSQLRQPIMCFEEPRFSKQNFFSRKAFSPGR